MALEIIKLLEIEERTAKNGKKYKGLKTSIGAMSCFDYNVLAELEKHIGQTVKVDYKVVNNFKNITAFLGIPTNPEDFSLANKSSFAECPVDSAIKTEEVLDQKDPKTASMILSYAKDLCCSDKCEFKDIEQVCITLKSIHKKIEWDIYTTGCGPVIRLYRRYTSNLIYEIC